MSSNEPRPHVLINLFRDLQLLATTEQLHERLLQAFRELYDHYSEQTRQRDNSSEVLYIHVAIKECQCICFHFYF